MVTLSLSVIVIALSMAGLAAGVLMGRGAPRGSCGGCTGDAPGCCDAHDCARSTKSRP